jgi:hypothetical protein
VSQKQLLLFSKGQGLTAKDKERLSKNGFLALECAYPTDVRMLTAAGAEFGGSRLLFIALDAINNSTINSKDGVRERFTRLLAQEIQKAAASEHAKACEPTK